MRARLIAICLLMLTDGGANAQIPAKPSPMKCETGPASRRFGGANWSIYSCDDKRSMVVVTSEGNPAAPFYFLLTPKAGGYAVNGEGTGDKRASDAAGDDISRLTPTELANLLAATKTVQRKPR